MLAVEVVQGAWTYTSDEISRNVKGFGLLNSVQPHRRWLFNHIGHVHVRLEGQTAWGVWFRVDHWRGAQSSRLVRDASGGDIWAKKKLGGVSLERRFVWGRAGAGGSGIDDGAGASVDFGGQGRGLPGAGGGGEFCAVDRGGGVCAGRAGDRDGCAMTTERGPAQAAYDVGAGEIAAVLEAGEGCGVPLRGDPFFYGSFMYLFARLSGRFEVEVVRA